MAIGDDFSVSVTGDIRHTANTNNYTVLELHRWLMDLADDAQASGNDLVDITSSTPSERSTDNIITLVNGYNIDDDAAKYFYNGSITQDNGDTVYSGLQVLGAVNDPNTQLMIIQDKDFYQFTPSPVDSPFWGTQASGGYNGNTAAGILMQCIIKTRVNGADIDGQRIRVQARHWGDTYDFFNVTLGQGVGVAAIGTTPDAQNDSSQSSVTVYSDVLNSGGTADAPTGGYQTIDLNDGSGAQPYYSKWTFNTNPDGLKAIWEYTKDLSGNGTTKSIDGLGGEFFLGVTHEWPYDNESGTFQEREEIVWGTDLTYDGLAGGTFSAGDYVTIGTNNAAGRVMYDNGTTNMIVALEDNTITLNVNDVITVADGVGAVTANVASPGPTNVPGGSGHLLALNDGGATGTMWIQLLTGAAPTQNVALRGLTSSATADVSSPGVTQRTVPKIFTGSYTGSYITAFGVGIDSGDVTNNDSLQSLNSNTYQPPNNVTFTVSGLVTGEDYVLVGPRSAGILNKAQLSLASPGLSGAAETSITVQEAIPAGTPSTGDGVDSTRLRVANDNGIFVKQPYTSITGQTFNLPSPGTDYSTVNATTGNDIFIAYIDRLVQSPNTALSYTAIYTIDVDLIVRVRDGGATPIVPFEVPQTFGSANVTVPAIRTSDA
jgi:hypothetical protein